MTPQVPVPMVRTLSGSPYRKFSDFFFKNGIQDQVFTIDSAVKNTIYASKGTNLIISPNSFVNLYGQPITGQVTIYFKEVFEKHEMLLSGQVSTSEDRLLESGGQIRILAFQQDQMLKLQRPVEVHLPVRGHLKNPLGVRLFSGSSSTTMGVSSKRSFDWKQASNKALKIQKIDGKKYFIFSVGHLNWFDIDYFYSKKVAKTMVSARFDCPLEKLDDKLAFLVFKNINALVRMYNSGDHFTSFNIPAKLQATLLIMGLRSGQLLFGKTEIEKTSNRVVQIKLNPISEKVLLEKITSLG